MAAGYSGRIFRAAIAARQRVDVLWDGQIYDLDLWAIPKAAANKDDAKRFIAFASEPGQMAAQAALIAYGPMRKSAIALVGKHPSLGIDLKDYLPTAPDNFRKALKFDEAWWNEHGAELATRFQTWRDQPVAVETKPSPADAKTKPTAEGKSKPAAASKPSTADGKSSAPDGETRSVPDQPQ
jgi:putative spermidine/putrescine transport system substrate-binding protein